MHVLDKQLSRSLCANFVHYVEKKYLVFSKELGNTSEIKMHYRLYNFQAFANISGNFRKY